MFACLSALFLFGVSGALPPPPDTALLYKFSAAAEVEWRVEDDTVMGGRSRGHFSLTEEGHGRFYGHVSLANNGGFSSIVHGLAGSPQVSEQSAFTLRVRGDGNAYTFRVKSAADQGYYHQAAFPTSGKWETIRIPFRELRPVHHGESVNAPDFTGGRVHTIQVLIGNGKAQDFSLLLDWIGAAE